MPRNFDGRPGSIALPSPLTIVSTTNSNPITVTVSGALPAQFFTGAQPYVHIYEHPTNTSANGIWPATPTGASTFTIPVAGVAISGGGFAQPLYLSNGYTLPSDGDADNAASVASWGQATGDRTQWLATRVGQFKLARREVFQLSNIGTTPWAHWPSGALTIGAVQQWVGDTAAWGTAIGAAEQLPAAGPGNVIFAMNGVVAGDMVSARLVTSFVTPALHAVALYSSILPFASIPAWPGSYGRVPMASAIADSCGTGFATTRNIVCEGLVTNSSPTSGVVWIQPAIWPLTADSPALQLVGEAELQVDIWRPTGMPQ